MYQVLVSGSDSYIMCQNFDLTLVPIRYTSHAQNAKGLV